MCVFDCPDREIENEERNGKDMESFLFDMTDEDLAEYYRKRENGEVFILFEDGMRPEIDPDLLCMSWEESRNNMMDFMERYVRGEYRVED